MNRITILSLLSMIFISTVVAQSSEEKVVAAAVESLHKAMIDADKNSLEKLTTKELSYGHSNGNVENNTEFIEAIISGKNDYKSIDISNQTITIVKNIAIVRHMLNAEILTSGGVITPKLGILSIWEKQKNKWELLARQACKL